MGIGTRYNRDGTITLSVEQQTWNEQKGGMDIHIVGEITMTLDEWLEAIVDILIIMPGKRHSAGGSGYAFAPVGADAEMVGALIAAKLRERL